MAKEKGWMKIYRDVQDNWLWSDKPFAMGQAWIDLLLTANHEDVKIIFNGSLTTVKTGQTITSVRKLAEKWGWSRDKTLKFLKMLVSEKMIEKDSDKFRTLITIVKYRDYQVSTDTKKTRNGHTTDTDKDTEKDTDSSQTRKKRMNKNEKERKENTLPSAQNSDDEDDDEWLTPEEAKRQYEEYLKRKEQGLDE